MPICEGKEAEADGSSFQLLYIAASHPSCGHTLPAMSFVDFFQMRPFYLDAHINRSMVYIRKVGPYYYHEHPQGGRFLDFLRSLHDKLESQVSIQGLAECWICP